MGPPHHMRHHTRRTRREQFRETEEFLRQQMDGQRELWAEEARQRARQSAGSASRVTQARVHVREANAKLASSVVKERKALEVRMQQEGAALLELKRQLAARVRRQAGLQMVRKIKESVISERMEQANVRRAEQAEDEAVISASRAACAEEKAARRGEIVRELAVGSRRSKVCSTSSPSASHPVQSRRIPHLPYTLHCPTTQNHIPPTPSSHTHSRYVFRSLPL